MIRCEVRLECIGDFILMRKWALSPIWFENDWIPTEDTVPLPSGVRFIRMLFFGVIYRRVRHSGDSSGLVFIVMEDF